MLKKTLSSKVKVGDRSLKFSKTKTLLALLLLQTLNGCGIFKKNEATFIPANCTVTVNHSGDTEGKNLENESNLLDKNMVDTLFVVFTGDTKYPLDTLPYKQQQRCFGVNPYPTCEALQGAIDTLPSRIVPRLDYLTDEGAYDSTQQDKVDLFYATAGLPSGTKILSEELGTDTFFIAPLFTTANYFGEERTAFDTLQQRQLSLLVLSAHVLNGARFHCEGIVSPEESAKDLAESKLTFERSKEKFEKEIKNYYAAGCPHSPLIEDSYKWLDYTEEDLLKRETAERGSCIEELASIKANPITTEEIQAKINEYKNCASLNGNTLILNENCPGSMQVRVTSSAGTVIYAQSYFSPASIDLTDIISDPGLYFVQMRNNDGYEKTFKFTKY